MRFLVDMGLDVRVGSWLREQRHDAVHLRDEGLQRLPNGDIFNKAIAERRVVLTVDLDFGEIAALTRGDRARVVLFRLYNMRTSHVIQRLSAVLPDCSEALERGAVVVVEEGRHRIRSLPIGERRDS
ncbi:MAG TPA: DUF5615 family PIN-like protein [Thermoplasmata archaeon]|nr:DUF5615 family PIN-like protein [Thermoplasmata archaeon]